jgi:hypothetical protein
MCEGTLGAGAGAGQEEDSLRWTSGGDQGGSNGADGPVSCRSQGAGPSPASTKTNLGTGPHRSCS